MASELLATCVIVRKGLQATTRATAIADAANPVTTDNNTTRKLARRLRKKNDGDDPFFNKLAVWTNRAKAELQMNNLLNAGL